MNTLTITSSAITNIELLRATIHITAGQQLESATVSHSDGVWSLNIDCGRSGSADVAQSYLDQTGGNYHMLVQPNYCPYTNNYSNIPTAMNFWFQANVTFSNHTVSLFFGQDGVYGTNYWWIGGPMILNSSPYKSPMAYLAVSNSTLYQVSFVNSAVNQLAISA
ncbi:MAG TPA: hypothetical protein VF608_06660 [Thermoanaerobaculia bacterium]